MKPRNWQKKVVPARKYLSLSMATVVVALGLLYSGWLLKLDYLIYDSYMQALQRPAPDDIVIISIDDRSLAELGRWPWPRAQHAQLIDKLTVAGVHAIALDLILAEPDRTQPASDKALARTLRNNGHVVLPVIPEQTEISGLLQETKPFGILERSAAALGHIDIELDQDGKVRRTFLRAGVGAAERPGLALAMLTAGNYDPGELSSIRKDAADAGSPGVWMRDQMFMIPFAGPSGYMNEISYGDAINMDQTRMRELFADKYVLIGATASGLGEKYVTPLGGSTRRAMPGVEILANIADALLRGVTIVPLSMPWQMLLTVLLVAPVYLIYRVVGARWAMPFAVAQLILTLVISFVLLTGAKIWFPPVTAALCIALSYPLWSWRRMYVLFNLLFQEKERAEVTLRSIGDAVITTNSDGRIDFMNPSAEELTGWSSVAACGQPIGSVVTFSTGMEAGGNENLLAPSSNKGGLAIQFADNSTIIARDGTLRDIHGSVAQIYDHDGKVAGGVVTMSDVSSLRQAAVQLSYQATHDTLTDLPNRSLLQDHLQRALSYAQRSGLKIGVLFIDLDRFKSVNDGLGHAAGDLVLEAVARRLQECHRGEDMVARLGGDEFVVVLDHIEKSQQVSAVARKISSALDLPVEINGRSYIVTASIGISVYPRDGETAEELIKNADAAMYRAKRKGRGYIQYYSPEMNQQALTRLDLERQLRNVHKRGELEIHYQPIYDLRRDTITGVEALLRWRHPERGLLGPDEFLPIAEESGFISELGKYVTHNVCSQAVKWRNNGLPRLRMAVNLSPRQLADPGLVETTVHILRETGMEPADLEFEITESLLASDPESVVDTLRSLKSLGVRMAIDDFGTGYSSLSRLKHFPVDSLKIDRSFVHDIHVDTSNGMIASAVIALAHSMKLKVVAEGVENNTQLQHLRSNGCDEIQGYYLSHPLPVAAMTALLVAGSGTAIVAGQGV